MSMYSVMFNQTSGLSLVLTDFMKLNLGQQFTSVAILTTKAYDHGDWNEITCSLLSQIHVCIAGPFCFSLRSFRWCHFEAFAQHREPDKMVFMLVFKMLDIAH